MTRRRSSRCSRSTDHLCGAGARRWLWATQPPTSVLPPREDAWDLFNVGTSSRFAIFIALAFAAGCGPHVTQNPETGDASIGAPPVCTPGDVQSCYSGPSGTAGVGPCVAGNQTCGGGGPWEPRGAEGPPPPQGCGDSIHDNRSGVADEGGDAP